MAERVYDLLIVGAGTAGLPCAIAAAEAGGKVLLVDKADRIGGTLHLSGGHFSAAGTRRQRERGIDDDADRHFAEILRISHDTVRRDLVGLAVDRAASTVDWLDDYGFDFDPETPRIVYGHEPYETARTYYGVDEGRSLLAFFERLLEQHLVSGAVELELGCAAIGLETRDGRVVGAELSGGSRSGVEARSTVLAAGGYGSSTELFREIDRRPLFSAASPTSTGDGLELARALGAGIAGRDAFLPTFGGLPAVDDPTRAQWADRPLLVAAERQPWEIYVDRRGRRFIAEDEASMQLKEEALAELEDLTFFTVFDDRAVGESADIVVGWTAADLRARAGKRVGVFVAESLGKLAACAGIDPAGLQATVDRYNQAVAAGQDVELGRTALPAPIARPPFYAMENRGITLITFGGLDVDSELRVRRDDGSTIPGLYAAGEILGAAATCGRAFCSGMMVMPAIVFGRLLGERLARSSY